MWAGHVSIEVGELCEEWAALLTEDLQMCHLRHHWIEPLLSELRKRAAKIPPFQVILSTICRHTSFSFFLFIANITQFSFFYAC
jgi:hypothetical protein